MNTRMGLTGIGSGEEELIDQEDVTIGDLIDNYGREAVRRGLKYTQSLHDADEEFRKSANPETMEEGYREAGVRGDIDPVTDEWSAGMEKSGLGLDDENTED